MPPLSILTGLAVLAALAIVPPVAAEGATFRASQASSPRSYRSAVVLLTVPGESVAQIGQARFLIEGVRRVFPAYWQAATRSLSTIDFAPVEQLEVEGSVFATN